MLRCTRAAPRDRGRAERRAPPRSTGRCRVRTLRARHREPSTRTHHAGQGVTFVTVAGEGQVPVGQLLGRPPKKSRWAAGWKSVVRWRDWSIPVKLSAVTLVPIIIALILGV